MTTCSSCVLLCQLSIANKVSNGSSVEALVSPTPPSYEEATAGTATHPPVFDHKVSVSLSSTITFGHVFLCFWDGVVGLQKLMLNVVHIHLNHQKVLNKCVVQAPVLLATMTLRRSQSSTGMIATSGGSLSGRYQTALLISVVNAVHHWSFTPMNFVIL